MINKSKLLICIIAIATILISTSSGFADVVIPGFAIKSNHIVGDKSGAEHVYHGEMITLVEDDVSIIVQAGTEKKKMKLAVKNEKLKENLLELYEKKSMRYGRYKFYLKDKIGEGAELLAVERIIGEKDCGTYYLADKNGDGWIFGYRLNLECDSESKNVNYFSLELSDEFFKVYSGYDIDEVFERFKGIPADIFIDNDGKLTGFLNEDEENEKEEITRYYDRLNLEPTVGAKLVDLKKTQSTNSKLEGCDSSIDSEYKNIAERSEASDKESLENSVIEDIAYAAENFILISEADYNENKFSGILGMPQKHGADTELIDDSETNLNQEFNVLDAKDMKGKKLEDSSKFIKTEKIKLEPGQVIYTSKRNAKSIGEIDEMAHVVLKNLKKYHINSGENSIENVSGNGLSRKCYLDIENENRVLLEDMDMVMVLESGRWKRFKIEDVMGIYDIESEFDCTLVRAPDQLDQIVSILFENLTRRPKYSNKAVGIVKNIERNNDVIEVTIDSYGEQKNFRCLKEKIDVSDMKLDDLALICYKGDEINGYKIFDEDEIEEKTFFIRGKGDLELLGFASNDNFGIGDSVRVLDEKMFIDIKEHLEKGQNIVVGKVLDDILLSKYEFIGGMDEKKVYKILEYDENSIIVGFGAEIDAEDEDFREEQKERLEFSESFELPQIVDKYSVVNLMLDENNKLEFLHAKRDAEYCDVTAYSSVSPTGNKHYSQASFRMGILKSHKLTDERFDGIIEYRDKMLRNMKMSQNRSDIKVYQLDVDTKGKPLELDFKSMQELKNLYDLKEITISDKDPHDNSDCPAFFEIENNELKSIVYINPIGDRLRGRFEEDDFVTNDNVKYEVDNLVVCDNNNRVMYYLLEVYKNEFGVDLVKIDGFRDYFVFIKDKTHISGERKNTIAIVNEIDSENHRASFINYETGYKSLYLDEMDEIIVKDIFENFKAGEIVKINCREFGKTGIAVESIEHFYDPLREKAPIYRLKNIDGLNLTLERGKLKARDYDVYIENIVEEKYKAVEGAKVMKWGIDRDLSKNDYLYAHFDEAGNIDFIQVIGEYELYLHAE